MAVRARVSPARVERDLAAVVAGSRMAAAEPTAEDIEAGRRILSGEVPAADVVRERLARIDTQFGVTR